jgi:murein L,D-transpeptidase YcbB/YkuD
MVQLQRGGGEPRYFDDFDRRTQMRIFVAKIDLRWPALAAMLLGTILSTADAQAQDVRPGRFDAASADIASTADEIRDLLLRRSESSTTTSPGAAVNAQLLTFYSTRDFRPAWTGDDTARENAAIATVALSHASEQGLRGALYTSTLSHWSAPPHAVRDAALYDLALTASFLRYASDVRTGRFAPNDVYKDVELPTKDFDAAEALAEALAHNSLDALIAELPPPQIGYRGLVEALARYRSIAAKGGWPMIPGRTEVALDGSDSRLALLLRRLAFEDPELAAASDSGGEELQVAVLRFQRRHGLDEDGRVGPAMIAELNIPASTRMQQIAANMERWRWLPRNFERRYIRVNVPDQSVEFVRNGQAVLHSKVIIGRKTSPTPILRTEVVGIVANPPWDIPGDIAAKQLLPHLRQNPNYLATRNMVLADGPADDRHGANINWHGVSDIPYQVQQVPGPDNVLGVLMLDSPNDFDVYLHDTGNRKTFAEKTREMSNGCVRVDQIFPLASLAFSNGASDDAGEIADAVSSGRTERLALREPMPLYLLYWTAIAQPGGTVEFRPDRYGRDRILIARLALAAGTPPGERNTATGAQLSAR